MTGNGVARYVWGDKLTSKCPTIRNDVQDGWLVADGQRMQAWVDGRLCTITWSGAWLNAATPDAASRRLKRLAVCTIYVHEAGHLAGYGHSYTGHGGIMRMESYPRYPACVRGLDWIEAMLRWQGYEA